MFIVPTVTWVPLDTYGSIQKKKISKSFAVQVWLFSFPCCLLEILDIPNGLMVHSWNLVIYFHLCVEGVRRRCVLPRQQLPPSICRGVWCQSTDWPKHLYISQWMPVLGRDLPLRMLLYLWQCAEISHREFFSVCDYWFKVNDFSVVDRKRSGNIAILGFNQVFDSFKLPIP